LVADVERACTRAIEAGSSEDQCEKDDAPGPLPPAAVRERCHKSTIAAGPGGIIDFR
jgi:hypothetical protein